MLLNIHSKLLFCLLFQDKLKLLSMRCVFKSVSIQVCSGDSDAVYQYFQDELTSFKKETFYNICHESVLLHTHGKMYII